MVEQSFWEMLRTKRDSLTKSGGIVADYLVQHAEDAQYLSISSLAKACGVAEATIFRFCRSLGFDGYNEMKIALAKATATAMPVALKLEPGVDTQTLVTHAYNTFTEMAAAAKALGYCALAVTDHAPAMPDAPHAWHFGNWSAMPRTIDGVAILYGAEANVMDTKGGLDLSQSQLKAQDWVVASIHSACVPGLLTRREANRLWLAVAENPYVDCIGHSEQENYRYDYDLVTRAFAKNHKVVELNGNSFNVRKDGIPNMRALLAACLANGCRIAVDSDAHSTYQLQHGLCALYAMLEEMQFPQELIVNATRENLVRELQLHGKPCAEEVGGILL